MIYDVKFKFSKKFIPSWTKKKLIDEFVARREFLVNLINPLYNSWNAEYIELYPDGQFADGMDFNQKYLDFIYNKQSEYLRLANSMTIGQNLVKLFPNEFADFTGVSSKYKTYIFADIKLHY